MATPTRPRVRINEGSGALFLSRVTIWDGSNAQQADISSITYATYDLDGDTPETAVGSGSLTVANVVFDALQTDAVWTKDSTGYNFSHAIPAADLPNGGHRYRVVYVFTPASGEAFTEVGEIDVLEATPS
jgi:hypothetical protein